MKDKKLKLETGEGEETTPEEETPEEETPARPVTHIECLQLLAQAVRSPVLREGMLVRVNAAAALLQWEAHSERMSLLYETKKGRLGRILRPN